MSWTSALSEIGSAASGAGSFVNDLGGGWINYSAGQSKLKDALRRQYEYAQSYAVNGPSWAVQGLRNAGLNPILAATDGAFSSPTLANPSMADNPSRGDFGASAFNSLGQRELQKKVTESQLSVNEAQRDLFNAQADKARSDKLHSDIGSMNDFFQGNGSPIGALREGLLRAFSEHGTKFDSAISELEDFMYGRSKETGVHDTSHMRDSSPSSAKYDDVVIPPSSSRRENRFMNDGIRFHEDDPERFRSKEPSRKDSSRKWSYRGSHPYLPFN